MIAGVAHRTGDVQCSVPLQSPVNLSFEPHDGSVHGVEYSPYHRNLFLTCASDCTARIYSVLQASLSLASEMWDVGIVMTSITSGQNNLTEVPHRRRTWTVQSYSPGGASVHPHLIHGSFGPPECTCCMTY